MSLLLPWLSLVFAAPIDAYPYRAELELPSSGIVQINVPLELRDPLNDRTGADLMLVDANGAAVPFAVVDGNPTRTRISGRRGLFQRADLSWEPNRDSDGTRYDVLVTGRALDGLTISLTSVPAAADVTLSRIEDDGTNTPLLTKRIFRLVHGDDTDLPVLLVPGSYRVEVHVLQRGLFEVPSIDGYRLSGPRIDAETRTVDLGAPQLQENGITLYDLRLSQPMPIEWVRLDPTADIFDRQAGIAPFEQRDELPGTLAPEVELIWAQPIQRIAIGTANISTTTLALRDSVPTDHYSVMVRGQPLTMSTAEVGARGLAILARDAGPGPHTLYGGAQQLAPDQDMQFAAEELARNVTRIVRPPAVETNPGFKRPPLPSPGVGPEFNDQGLKFGRSVQGEGLVRIPLDEHVLTHGRPDLGDLRLRTPDGHQVAYALRRSAEVGVADNLAFKRVERGKTSKLEVTLPESGLPIQHLVLHTSDPSFSRQVTVSRKAGKRLHTLRSVSWQSDTNPTLLRLGIGDRVGETLAIEIDNGDDPPLSVDRIDVSWSRWELVANLPSEGADLRYGDPDRYRPGYDAAPSLAAIRDAPIATLGDVDKRTYVAPALERTATFAGLGCVGLGLLGMLGLLIRGAPNDPEATDEEEDDAVASASPEPPPAEPEPSPPRDEPMDPV